MRTKIDDLKFEVKKYKEVHRSRLKRNEILTKSTESSLLSNEACTYCGMIIAGEKLHDSHECNEEVFFKVRNDRILRIEPCDRKRESEIQNVMRTKGESLLSSIVFSCHEMTWNTG